ncbi:MAG: hypothetical protein DME60_12490 [Verrucomicrobia bacterium]|nr:MAG: hypothetical protein DME60_12490 [Verrucomicrobiota bacterium]
MLVSASRRNNLCLRILPSVMIIKFKEKFAIARTRSPTRETHALPKSVRRAAWIIRRRRVAA